ncbi:MAG: argininosuccinate synthase [Planctomycetes bacterium]|nr:argininosuccinate synthase [Planctomycetota bacterium]
MAKKVAVAFSGGLDTSFCVLHLKNEGHEVHTCTIDTGGFSADQIAKIERRAFECGATSHKTIDGRKRVYDGFVAYIIKGNVLRGEVYPLCVAAERVAQAEMVAEYALERGFDSVCHGSTGAGNDQIRFDTSIRIVAPGLEVLTPIRDLGIKREEEARILRDAGIPVEVKTQTISYNESLWGTTAGGGATHNPWNQPPEEAYGIVRNPRECTGDVAQIEIEFERGLPVRVDGRKLGGIEIIELLNKQGGENGVGRGIHLGDTILGIKGRIAFEAPAPLILIRAHRELEKLVLTRWQLYWKKVQADFYGQLLHEGQYFDPVMRDLEAFIDSTQRRVTGAARVNLYAGNIDVVGVRSPHSLVREDVAKYGEEFSGWTAQDAKGYGRILSVQPMLYRAAGVEETKDR